MARRKGCSPKRSRRKSRRSAKSNPLMLWGGAAVAVAAFGYLFSQSNPAGHLMPNGQTVQQNAQQAGF